MSTVQTEAPSRQAYPSADLPTIILVDDRALTRQCLAHWLELNDQHVRIVGIPRLEHPERLLRQYGRIDLVVLNIGATDASALTVKAILERMREILPNVPLVLLSDREDITAVTEAIRHGARGYIPTSLESHLALEALHFVQAGGTFIPASVLFNGADFAGTRILENGVGMAESEMQFPRVLGFTQRERQVLEHLRRGKPNKIIAHELAMRESTVKVHVRRIMKKLNATNRTQVAFLAQRLAETGLLIEPPAPPRATAPELPGATV